MFIVIVIFEAARRHRLPIALRIAATWKRLRPTVVDYIKASPATFVYLMILSVTTMVMVSSSHRVVALLLEEHSTNLHQLFNSPLRALALSAFWAPNYEFLVWAILFALVLAPAERWLGTRRWAIVFVSGHVFATLGVAWGLWFAIQHGYASHHLENAIDVGVSYGFAAVAALFTFRIPRKWRWWWAGLLTIAAVAAVAVGRTFTDSGHLLAVIIGFACYPLTRTTAIAERTRSPIWAINRSTRNSPPAHDDPGAVG
ncbi:MAG: hypothetical protein HIU57_08710 [Acidobacteria bacterium]|nr:hypothetical protein [Acidobacteriota bacterium]